ncbi:DeoR/GlpR family DNA-binding transcription regulator [Propionispora vibrioides]|uniref:Transcriptional regulator, DeoR family n=1 Tax=Propionispora vibrioides TaxID=112903 RepID=A0A1H8T770_9FIRM|nr:DeoR/GlpR family DNA-binding transcription regulator [Propionispora vibrioides]SEO86358.1 transcriptional regulator, DeoR family [Propionispora vibrioides]
MVERIEYILNKLDETGVLNVNELAEELKVSSATIRRDFADLEIQRKLKRIPGGAIKPLDSSIVTLDSDLRMASKLQLNSSGKKMVCEMACKEVRDGECIFIDAGTSTVHMFKLLQDRLITIVTNNFLLSSQITPPITARIIVVGGLYLADYALTYSSTAINEIQGYNFDRCFITCAGVDIHKNFSYSTEIETRNLKNLVCQRSKYRYLLLDQSKLDTIGFCTLEPLTSFDTVFCDQKREDMEYPDNFRFYQSISN